MSTVGNTSITMQTYSFYGINVSNVLAAKIVMPEPGIITDLSQYYSAKSGINGGSTTSRLCIWRFSDGVLLAQTADIVVGAGTGGIGGQSTRSGALTSPYTAQSGEELLIGLWRRAGHSHEWTEQNGGTQYQATDSSNTVPNSSESFSSTSGTLLCYATYTPISAYADNGSAWQAAEVWADNGSAWQKAEVWADNGAAWERIG